MPSSKSTSTHCVRTKEEGFRLKDVLEQVDIPEATYHYHIKQMGQEDPDKEWKALIISKTFEKHEGRYGYRRFHVELKAQGYILIIRRTAHHAGNKIEVGEIRSQITI